MESVAILVPGRFVPGSLPFVPEIRFFPTFVFLPFSHSSTMSLTAFVPRRVCRARPLSLSPTSSAITTCLTTPLLPSSGISVRASSLTPGSYTHCTSGRAPGRVSARVLAVDLGPPGASPLSAQSAWIAGEVDDPPHWLSVDAYIRENVYPRLFGFFSSVT